MLFACHVTYMREGYFPTDLIKVMITLKHFVLMSGKM